MLYTEISPGGGGGESGVGKKRRGYTVQARYKSPYTHDVITLAVVFSLNIFVFALNMKLKNF